MIDLDALEAAADALKSVRAAYLAGYASIGALNVARQNYDDATQPDAILSLIAEVRALRAHAEPTNEMIRAGLAVQWPALYRDGLYSEHDGARLRNETERRIAILRRQYIAMQDARAKEKV